MGMPPVRFTQKHDFSPGPPYALIRFIQLNANKVCTMTNLNVSRWLKTMFLSVAFVGASASAAPIMRDMQAVGAPAHGGASAVVSSGGGSEMFTHLGINGGYQHSVSFRGEDDSIVLGHYAKGPWSKNQFLRAWQDMRGGNGDAVPSVVVIPQQATGLPEPSTFALFGLGLGLLTLGALRRRQTKS